MKKSMLFIYMRRIKFWINLFLASLLALGIFILLEILSSKHNLKVDLTPSKAYTLSEQARKILKSIESEVTFITFYRMGERAELDDFFQRLCYPSPKIKYRLIDLERYPGKAKLYGISTYGSTVVESNGKRKIIPYPTEERAINVILKLTRSEEKIVYFSIGHGENEGYGDLKEALDTENWKVEDIYLMQKQDIPLDGSVLVIGGPKKDFLEHEIGLLEQYLHKGGKIVLLLEPFMALPNLEDFLKKYRIILSNDIIIDKQNKLFGGDYFAPLIPYYARHPITKELQSASIFSTARSVEIEEEADNEISIILIARSAPHSWTKTNHEVRKGDIDFRDGVDRRGPVNVAVLVTVPKEGEGGRKTDGEMVCFGDSDFIKDAFYQVLGNKDLFLNTVEWLARDKDLISIRPSKFEHPYHFLSANQGRFIFGATLIVLPAIFLVIGVAIFLFRKVRG